MEEPRLNNINILRNIFINKESQDHKKYKVIQDYREYKVILNSKEDFVELFESFIYAADYISKIVNNIVSEEGYVIKDHSEVLRILNRAQNINETKENAVSSGLACIYRRICFFFNDNEFNLCFGNRKKGEYKNCFSSFRNSMEKIEKLCKSLNKYQDIIKPYKNNLYNVIANIENNYNLKSNTGNHYHVDICYTKSGKDPEKIIEDIINEINQRDEEFIMKINCSSKEFERQTKKSESKGWFGWFFN